MNVFLVANTIEILWHFKGQTSLIVLSQWFEVFVLLFSLTKYEFYF